MFHCWSSWTDTPVSGSVKLRALHPVPSSGMSIGRMAMATAAGCHTTLLAWIAPETVGAGTSWLADHSPPFQLICWSNLGPPMTGESWVEPLTCAHVTVLTCMNWSKAPAVGARRP